MSELWKHQKTAIDKAELIDNLALLFDTGTGKTRTSIEIIRNKFNKKRAIVNTVIICPIIVLENWKKEILKFSKIPQDKIYIVYGSKKLTILKNAIEKGGIVITNYESLLQAPILQGLKKFYPDILILDESQRCKNHQSKRTKAVTEISDLCVNRYILSGTPILNSPMDIFAQYRILDGGETFGKNFFGFRAKFFYDKNSGMPKDRHFPDWRILPGAEKTINDLIYSKAVRAVKEECIDLPDYLKQTVYIELSSEQRKLYNSVKKDFVAYIDDAKDRAVVADLAITKALRLQQIASGYAVDDSGSIYQFKEDPRSQALEELLEDITPHSKVIVWACFINNYEQIRRVCEKLKIRYVEAHGGISSKSKFEAVEAFDKDESVRVFIGHPGSLGVGINLISASYSIYFSRNFSLENDLQSEARNYRAGAIKLHSKITRIDIVAKETIDESVSEALSKKMNISEQLLTWSDKV